MRSVGDCAGGVAKKLFGPSICHVASFADMHGVLNFSWCTLDLPFLTRMCLLRSMKLSQTVLTFFAVTFTCYKTASSDLSFLETHSSRLLPKAFWWSCWSPMASLSWSKSFGEGTISLEENSIIT